MLTLTRFLLIILFFAVLWFGCRAAVAAADDNSSDTAVTIQDENAVEDSKTVINQLKDETSNLQTVMAETDKKIVSLESRFESLRDDPAAVAIEMTNLQNKAVESFSCGST